MLAQEMKETVGLNQCHTCGAEGFERDKFCRRCGVNHSFRTAPLTGGPGETEPFECETRQLPDIESHCYSLSGALAQAVTRGVSERTSPFRNQRWAMRLVSALVAVPLWLMIVLLSPLDAYVAARAIAKQVWTHAQNHIAASQEQLFARVNQLSQLAGLSQLPPFAFGATPEKFIGGYGQSLGNLFRNDYRAWRVGVSINLPLGNRTAKAHLGRALVEGKQIDAERQRAEQLIEVEVRNALQAVETARRRVEAAKSSRTTAEAHKAVVEAARKQVEAARGALLAARANLDNPAIRAAQALSVEQQIRQAQSDIQSAEAEL